MGDANRMAPGDVLAALGLLTRLPVPGRHRAAAWAFPLAGLVVGAIAAVVASVAMWLGVPGVLAALLALVVQAVLTGAMHEDGLADCCDGLWGGWSRAARLRIMKDSHIGTYGVLGLVLVVLLRWSALALLFDAGAVWGPLLAAAVLSRVPMVALMAGLRNARGTGLSAAVGRADWPATGIAALIALFVTAVAGMPVFWPAVLVLLVTVAIGALAEVKIGGQTGDVLGASQQLAEAAVLMSLAAAI